MPAPTILGTDKGIFGTTQRLTGMITTSTDFDFSADKVEYPDEHGNTTAVAFHNPKIKFSIKGLLIAGTEFTSTIADSVTLASLPDHLPSGYTAGLSIIDSIKIGEEIKGWQTIEATGENYPEVA